MDMNKMPLFIDEAYVGETKFIKDFIELIHEARAPYIGKFKKPIKGNKTLIKIGDMIAKEFGFYSVDFWVPFDSSMNAFTYPITLSTDNIYPPVPYTGIVPADRFL